MATMQNMGDSKQISGSAPSNPGKPDFSDYGKPGLKTENVNAQAEVASRISAAKSTTDS